MNKRYLLVLMLSLPFTAAFGLPSPGASFSCPAEKKDLVSKEYKKFKYLSDTRTGIDYYTTDSTTYNEDDYPDGNLGFSDAIFHEAHGGSINAISCNYKKFRLTSLTDFPSTITVVEGSNWNRLQGGYTCQASSPENCLFVIKKASKEKE